MSQDDRPIYLPERTRVEASSLTDITRVTIYTHSIARDQTYTLTEEDEFLIMRCEGIWDVLTSQEEVRELALEASRLNTFDNVSVVVVCFLSADEMVTRLLRRRSNGVVDCRSLLELEGLIG
ncbi:hypothetical protein IGI04_031084 [Brassica rapa subsp. trilocularis]|uniref:PPM-type phosphatase domain-containing protein n=2 Tax=Brassica campestris TaxID=3711 RepID=A0ABQ7LSK8_BRACM|nr:hypothetical protein IGI04_031084 [Brassica rapa subsp. trilocularis]